MGQIQTNIGTKIDVYTDIQDMIGVGEEWLIDAKTETVRAVFIDGVLACQILVLPVGNNEITKVA